jgi:branched-chain amino acid transport system ATP-binding protein
MHDVALRAEGLAKHFGGLRAVQDVSIELEIGRIHALIGPNGAGKSTLINLLSGDLHVTSGTIHIGERRATRLGPDRRGRAGLGRSYQKTTIFPRATTLENVRLAAQAHAPKRLSLFSDPARDTATNERARAALEEVGLGSRGHVVAAHLSHGEQRQLEIAMVLATAPRVILLDEPLAGMGHAEAQLMIDLVRRVKVGRAVLLVEHDMDAVFALADVLTVMADGQVIARGTPAEVRAHPAVRLAYLGEDEPGEVAA